MKVGQALRDLRKSRKLSQVEVGKKVGVSQTFLSQIESDDKEASPAMLRKLCKFYKIPPPVLFWKSLSEKDVKKEKLSAFRQLNPIVNDLITEVFGI